MFSAGISCRHSSGAIGFSMTSSWRNGLSRFICSNNSFYPPNCFPRLVKESRFNPRLHPCRHSSSTRKAFGNDFRDPISQRRFSYSSSSSHGVYISAEVQNAIEKNEPVVALESAIITHGMPFPTNIETALGLQNRIRAKGVVPATIGVVKGKLTVGLSDEEIEFLGSPPPPDRGAPMVKVSRRDLPYVMAQKLSGGTTVAGTIIGASWAGIPIFATGGIGGVHRGAETTFDISSDLRELGRSSIAVVSAGVKSILDIGKTLEYLETEGVCVCVMKRRESSLHDTGSSGESQPVKFPAFFTAESPFPAPYALINEVEAAELVHASLQLGLQSGILIAVPIPKGYEASSIKIERAIEAALEKARAEGIGGKDMTPFLLGEINRVTRGDSLKANQHLIENNVTVASDIAIELAKLKKLHAENSSSSTDSGTSRNPDKTGRNEIPYGVTQATSPGNNEALTSSTGRPVVIGGSNLDLILAVQEDSIVEDGRTHGTQIRTSPGGVGRNIAEALTKLRHNPFLISAIGKDLFGHELLTHCTRSKMDSSGILLSPVDGCPTAIYSAVLTAAGECLFGLGDMTCHTQISPTLLSQHRALIRSAPIVILDGNIPTASLEAAMEICLRHSVPVWFEPTEVRKVRKLLEVPKDLWSSLTYISPNLRELQSLALLQDERDDDGELGNVQAADSLSQEPSELQSILAKCFRQFTGLKLILLTRGKDGFTVVSRNGESPVGFSMESFPSPGLEPDEKLLSVSGAGDCLNAGFISGLLNGLSIQECALKGSTCAKASLKSLANVPDVL